MPPDLIDRLGPKFTFDPDGCWRWTRPQSHGYGQAHAEGGPQPAHRVLYALLRGPVPPDRQVHHRCGVRACVNPAHMEIVTPREHAARHLRDECVNGHAFTEANTYWHKTTRGVRRQCRRCKIERQRVSRGSQ